METSTMEASVNESQSLTQKPPKPKKRNRYESHATDPLILSLTLISILRGLAKCQENQGITLDTRFKRSAQKLVALRLIEVVVNDRGQRVYLINDYGRSALKRQEKRLAGEKSVESVK